MRSELPTRRLCTGMVLLILTWIGCESVPPERANDNGPTNRNNPDNNKPLCRDEFSDDCRACQADNECDDGDFCAGRESCVEGVCRPSQRPCAGPCDEEADACIACQDDADCDDAAYCNGVEACVESTCVAGGRPCSGLACDEQSDACSACRSDADCDDGVHCTDDVCDSGVCRAMENDAVCPGESLCIGNDSERAPRARRTGCQDPCRSQCELCAAACPGDSGSALPSYAVRRAVLVGESVPESCAEVMPYIAAGVCDDDKLFLLRRRELLIEADVYDAATGAPLGRTTQSECVDDICQGRSYWPDRVECRNVRITEVLCGRLHDIGDVVELP